MYYKRRSLLVMTVPEHNVEGRSHLDYTRRMHNYIKVFHTLRACFPSCSQPPPCLSKSPSKSWRVLSASLLCTYQSEPTYPRYQRMIRPLPLPMD